MYCFAFWWALAWLFCLIWLIFQYHFTAIQVQNMAYTSFFWRLYRNLSLNIIPKKCSIVRVASDKIESSMKLASSCSFGATASVFRRDRTSHSCPVRGGGGGGLLASTCFDRASGAEWVSRRSRLIRMHRCEAVSKTITDEIYHSQSNHTNLDRRGFSPSICDPLDFSVVLHENYRLWWGCLF